MRFCPICATKREDSRFRSRMHPNRMLPVCVQCYDSWRIKQREMAYEVNRSGRKLEELPVAPWMIGTYDVASKRSFTRNERIEYMLKKAGIRLPTNPTYVK